ncbi:PTS sugar transporter subunit IIB [Enterococcus saccharolyticus]|uniref:PTS mannose/fructose/sorbose transporter subunit IIAB n=1 Tax=Enterococcus saccharolyticus TaxID=41997 RepID=UPI001E61F061|nr:PTS mannose/fructose/sorbose transporter subunit IIAB [Enterococcus saccharolyticus]MCD5002374.1 PTS sugar transporter subunit IIB [Enterococcus saccharolyticus]
MKAIVFVGHGELPTAMKNSVQMIAGENKHLFSVSLLPEDGKEEFVEKLNKLNESLLSYDTILFFSDLLGGSPNNGIVEKYFSKSNVEIISGMNLPIVLTAIMAEHSTDMLISEGRNGIQNVKGNTDSCVKSDLKNEKAQQKSMVNKKNPFVIKEVRIDARGIHGQVATQWVPKLEVDRIIVIDDKAIKDEIQKMALKMAKPNSVKLSILSTKKAIERLTEKFSYSGESLLIILQQIDTLKKLADQDYYFEEVNIGNVPNRTGTKAYQKTIHLTEEEITILKNLIHQGTHFTAQMVPNDSKVDFDNIINS